MLYRMFRFRRTNSLTMSSHLKLLYVKTARNCSVKSRDCGHAGSLKRQQSIQSDFPRKRKRSAQPGHVSPKIHVDPVQSVSPNLHRVREFPTVLVPAKCSARGSCNRVTNTPCDELRFAKTRARITTFRWANSSKLEQDEGPEDFESSRESRRAPFARPTLHKWNIVAAASSILMLPRMLELEME